MEILFEMLATIFASVNGKVAIFIGISLIGLMLCLLL